jgi:hypothetical protein
MFTHKYTFLIMTVLSSYVLTSHNPADELVYLDINTIFDRQFDVVWAFGNAVPQGSVNMSFSQTGSDLSFQMSGQCDFSGSYSLGEKSVMDWNWDGDYTTCTEANVKNSIDHWRNNRDVNNAQQYILYASAFGSSWALLGDRDHTGDVIMPLVGQHVLSHPKFLDKEYEAHVEKYA